MTLASWLEPLPDAEAMRAADAAAIAAGTPGIELMERAARGLARVAGETFPDGRITFACGKGNNGGDGYAAARLLHERGREVRTVALAPPSSLEGDAAVMAARAPADALVPWISGSSFGDDGVVDCLLGTGATGEPRDAFADAVRAMDGCRVVACDVPSGVDASTGEVAGLAVRAAATATFAAGKPGLWIHPGKAHAGRVAVVEIGVSAEPSAGLIGDAVLDELPVRGASSTKFSAGHVLVCGGSRGMTGAVVLAARAAARAGAGYVTALVPPALEAVFEVKLTEVMTRGTTDPDAVLDAAARGGALVLGNGLGGGDDARALARAVAARAELPLVVDADGLNAHAIGDFRAREVHPTVLTPHTGELGRLLGRDREDVEAARLASARAAAAASGAIVVLKGDDTLVAAPDGRLAVSPGGAPALATAGTGDVLSGILGAFLATGGDPFTMTCSAVLAHVHAGRAAARPHGPASVIASDVIAALPQALAR